MPQASARVSEEIDAEIREYSAEHDLSRSDAIRALIERGTEYDRVQQDRERLKRNMQQLIEQQEEKQELVEYVGEERTIQQRREARRSAPLWRRAKWFVFGRSAK